MSNLHREHSIDASYQVSIHLAKQFQRRFLKIGQSETRIACGGHVWYSVTCLFYTLQVGIHILVFFLANLAKGNMSFCHHLVSVVCHSFTFHIAKQLQRRRFLGIDQPETRIARVC
jgi:hypothetical protein